MNFNDRFHPANRENAKWDMGKGKSQGWPLTKMSESSRLPLGGLFWAIAKLLLLLSSFSKSFCPMGLAIHMRYDLVYYKEIILMFETLPTKLNYS